MGIFITDGNVSYNTSHSASKKYYTCELKSADHYWLTDISNLCGEHLRLTKANNSKCLRLRIHNTKIGEWLISHECIPNKTLKVKFPIIPDNYLADFIRGCWDGDGSINISLRKNGYIEQKAQLYSASKDFIYSIKNILQEKYNIISHIYEVKMQEHKMKNGTIIKAKNQLYQLSINGKYCKLFAEKIYYSNHKLSMPRKNETAQKIISW